MPAQSSPKQRCPQNQHSSCRCFGKRRSASSLRNCSGECPCQSILQGIELIVPLLKTVGGTSLRHDLDSEVCHLSCRPHAESLPLPECCSVTPLFCSMPAAGMPMADTAKGGIGATVTGGPFHLPFPLPSAGSAQSAAAQQRSSAAAKERTELRNGTPGARPGLRARGRGRGRCCTDGRAFHFGHRVHAPGFLGFSPCSRLRVHREVHRQRHLLHRRQGRQPEHRGGSRCVAAATPASEDAATGATGAGLGGASTNTAPDGTALGTTTLEL